MIKNKKGSIWIWIFLALLIIVLGFLIYLLIIKINGGAQLSTIFDSFKGSSIPSPPPLPE